MHHSLRIRIAVSGQRGVPSCPLELVRLASRHQPSYFRGRPDQRTRPACRRRATAAAFMATSGATAATNLGARSRDAVYLAASSSIDSDGRPPPTDGHERMQDWWDGGPGGETTRCSRAGRTCRWQPRRASMDDNFANPPTQQAPIRSCAAARSQRTCMIDFFSDPVSPDPIGCANQDRHLP